MFRSFFLAGFECATGYNARGEWIDQVAATRHDQHADADYRMLRDVGIFATREAIRWPIVDRGGRYDFSSVKPFLRASRRYGIDVIWDLFHYGYPAELDPFSDNFVARFADYCQAAANHICENHPGPCYFTPVNEPSFFSWAGGTVGRFAPHSVGRGPELKRALIRAAIQGINAIRAAVPHARIVNVDPLCHVLPWDDTPEARRAADDFNLHAVFESWDMLAGRLMPELGGSREHLGIVGINYYWTNQWILGRDEQPLPEDHPARVPLRTLIRRVYERYGGDVLITETSHVDDQRPRWLKTLVEEVDAVLTDGIPLKGVCLYPILGMPEWHDQSRWTQMGLWELHHGEIEFERRLCHPMYQELVRAQSRVNRRLGKPDIHIPLPETCYAAADA